MDTYLKTIITSHASEQIRKNEADGISFSVMHMVWPVSRDWLSALSCYFYKVPAPDGNGYLAPFAANKTHDAFVREKEINRNDGDRFLLAAMTAQALLLEDYIDSTVFRVKTAESEFKWSAADGPLLTAAYPELAEDIDEAGNITNTTKCCPSKLEEIEVSVFGKQSDQGFFRSLYLEELLTPFVAENYRAYKPELSEAGYV